MFKKLLLFFVPFVLVAADKPFAIARNGRAQCQIVLAESANKFDKMAANDLQYYLGKITGAKFEIVSEKQAKGRGIYVGETVPAKKFKPFKDEEWCISSADGNKLILSGGKRIVA